LVSDNNGEDRFVSRIGVGGLLNIQKIHQAHIVLRDIQRFHEHAAKINEKQQTLENKNSGLSCDNDARYAAKHTCKIAPMLFVSF